MLKKLSIDNYVLIDALEVDFSEGLTMITGETGAGKSILLGALSLILGQRAEAGVAKDSQRNCVVEGIFHVGAYPGMEELLQAHEIDFEEELIIRRVITAAGKSRAFVNDSPAGLPLLRLLGEKLIDIHAQHENLLLRQSDFQLELIDAYAGLFKLRSEYQSVLTHYKHCVSALEQQKRLLSKGSQEQDYLHFQWEQLTAARLVEGEQQELEEEQSLLAHAGEIKGALFSVLQLLQEQEGAALPALRESVQSIQKISAIYPAVEALGRRLESVRIEAKDICAEVQEKLARIQDNPPRLEEVNQRLDTLYSLQQKHKCSSVEELILYRDRLATGFKGMEEAQEQVILREKEVQEAQLALAAAAAALSHARRQTLPKMQAAAVDRLKLLGIPHAELQLNLYPVKEYGSMGQDRPEFLFSANKEMALGELSKIASGGELSRIMLCMKSLMVQANGLPTIIFDEIDLGVSGRIADMMGVILEEMSQNMQVIAISHLPQIASKGASHLVVYKEHKPEGSRTDLKKLSPQERVMEIARLLSGSQITPAAVDNAKQLLTQTKS